MASIAMRTWIYVAPSDRATKLGYFRAGAVVDRSEVSAGTEGCDCRSGAACDEGLTCLRARCVPETASTRRRPARPIRCSTRCAAAIATCRSR